MQVYAAKDFTVNYYSTYKVGRMPAAYLPVLTAAVWARSHAADASPRRSAWLTATSAAGGLSPCLSRMLLLTGRGVSRLSSSAGVCCTSAGMWHV